MTLSPANKKRLQRFKENRRGYLCLKIFIFITVIAMMSEIFFNSKALMVSYEGNWFFPVFGKTHQSITFGGEGKSEPDYLELQQRLKEENRGNWVFMPLVPYDAAHISKINQAPIDKDIVQVEKDFQPRFEAIEALSELSSEERIHKKHDLTLELNIKRGTLEKLKYPPLPPDAASKHYLGTDNSGRDVLARLMYGYRIAICFALILLLLNYSIGVTLGCLMGYLGGIFDILVQRVIEVIHNIPFLYVIMIIAAVQRSKGNEMGFWSLVGVYAMFGWMGMTWYMRTAVFKEKAREYILAAKANGATNSRVIFEHLIPNVVSLLVTFIPFSVSGAIIGLTSLDYLGYGLPKGTPSWGELIKVGTEDMNSPWIVLSVVSAMIVVLFLINSIGEAVREAFDPKQIFNYE